ncbi:MAG: hypothetical protein WD061_03730 [Candidatus Saccharimonadales bacterium]
MLRIKIKHSLIAVGRVLARPKYAIVAVASAFLMGSIILWALNLDLVWFILFQAPLGIIDKFSFLVGAYAGLYTIYTSAQSTGILLFSVVFGINIALVVYTLRNIGFSNIPKKSGFSGMSMAVLSGGCAACGVSILAPLLASIGATSVVFIQQLSVVFSWVGAMFVGYSIYKLGQVVGYVRAKSLN